MIPMLAFYLMVLIVIGMILYAGYEGTIRVFAYLDLELRFTWVKFRLWMMRRKLKQQLLKDLPEFNKLMKEKTNGK
jgi:hypothetical protein